MQLIKNIYLLKFLEFYSKSQNDTVSPKGSGTMKRNVTMKSCITATDESDSEGP